MKRLFYYRVISVLIINLLLLPSVLLAFENNPEGKTTLAPQLLINVEPLKSAYMEFSFDKLGTISSQHAGAKRVTGLPLRRLLAEFPDNPCGLLKLITTPSNAELIESYLEKTDQASSLHARAGIISLLGMIKAKTAEEKDVIRALLLPYLDSKEPLEQLSAYSALSKIGTTEEQILAVMKLLEAATQPTSNLDKSKVFQLLLDAEMPWAVRDFVSEQLVAKFVSNTLLYYPPVFIELLKKNGLSKKAAKLFDENFFEKLMDLKDPEHYVPIIEMLAQEAGKYPSLRKRFRHLWKMNKDYPVPSIKYLIFLSNLEPSFMVIKDIKHNIIYNKKIVSDFAQAVLAGFEREIKQRQPKNLKKRLSKIIMLKSIGYQDNQAICETLAEDIKNPYNRFRFISFYGLRKLGIVNDGLKELMREQAENKDEAYYGFFQALVVRELDFDEEFKTEIIKKILTKGLSYIYNTERMMEIIKNNHFSDKALLLSIIDNIGVDNAVSHKGHVFFNTRALLSGLIAKEEETIRGNIFNLSNVMDITNFFITDSSEKIITEFMSKVNTHREPFVKAGMLASLTNITPKDEKEKAFIRFLIQRYLKSKEDVIRAAAEYARYYFNSASEKDKAVRAMLDIAVINAKGAGDWGVNHSTLEAALQLLERCEFSDNVKQEVTEAMVSLLLTGRGAAFDYCPGILKKSGLTKKALKRLLAGNIILNHLAEGRTESISMIELLVSYADEFPEISRQFKEGLEQCSTGYLIFLGNGPTNETVIEDLKNYLLRYPSQYQEKIAYLFLLKKREELQTELDMLNSEIESKAGYEKRIDEISSLRKQIDTVFLEVGKEMIPAEWERIRKEYRDPGQALGKVYYGYMGGKFREPIFENIIGLIHRYKGKIDSNKVLNMFFESFTFRPEHNSNDYILYAISKFEITDAAAEKAFKILMKDISCSYETGVVHDQEFKIQLLLNLLDIKFKEKIMYNILNRGVRKGELLYTSSMQKVFAAMTNSPFLLPKQFAGEITKNFTGDSLSFTATTAFMKILFSDPTYKAELSEYLIEPMSEALFNRLGRVSTADGISQAESALDSYLATANVIDQTQAGNILEVDGTDYPLDIISKYLLSLLLQANLRIKDNDGKSPIWLGRKIIEKISVPPKGASLDSMNLKYSVNMIASAI